jgi:curved DNA-binding protein CbpA
VQSTKDLYKILGLPTGASQNDIRKAHRKLVRKYHPDANPQDPRAVERFKAVQQAYEVLSNEKKRREYDKRFHTSSREGSSRPRPRGGGSGGRSGEESTSTVDLSDLLSKLKDAFEKARTGRSSARNEDVSGERPSGVSNKSREKKVKGPSARGKEKRVKGPSARRNRKSN